MKVLGKIGGDEYILDREYGSRALRLVNAIPDPSGDIRMIQLEIDLLPYKRGDILVSDGRMWKKVSPPEETVGDVTGVICPRMNRDVKIRWMDPLDTEKYVWKHTLLLRKHGSFPVDIHDGVVVVDSYNRDNFVKNVFHDVLPPGTEDNWYYRFFTFSEDNVWHTSDLCVFQPIELSWKTINQIVQSGLAKKVFDIGDAIEINGVNPDDPFYSHLEFEVVAFDQAQPEDLEKTHSITFGLIGTLGNYPSVFDKGWDRYVLTNDARVTDHNKSYWVYDELTGEFTEVTGLPVGKLLTPGMYYEQNNNTDRIEKGGNRWSMSAIRAWLNSTDPNNKWKFLYNCPEDETPSPPLTMLPKEVVAAISPARNTTALPKTDGRGGEITVDKLFLLSETEVKGTKIEEKFYTITTDTNPQEIYVRTSDEIRVEGKSYFVFDETLRVYRPARENDFNEDGSFKSAVEYFELHQKQYFVIDAGVYRPCTDDDFTPDHEFKDDVDYYDEKILLVEENPFIPHYNDEDLQPRIHCSGDGIARSWWLRTPEINSDTNMKFVKDSGDVPETSEVSTSYKHIVFGFTIS